MDESVDFSLELITLLLVLAFTLPYLAFVINFMLSPTYGGFDTPLVEKTALATTGEIEPSQRNIDRNDVMLMLAVADEYVANPVTYKINAYQFDIDGSYFSNRVPFLMNAFANMDASNKKLTLYYGPTGPRMWVIENE